jgi:hypothetical protein
MAGNLSTQLAGDSPSLWANVDGKTEGMGGKLVF